MRRSAVPSLGATFAVASGLVCALFLGWGLSRPRLDQAWELLINLETGKTEALSHGEFSMLQDILWDYPDLAESLLQGQAAGIISAHRQGQVTSEFVYVLRRDERAGASISWTSAFQPDSAGAMQAPSAPRYPQLIEVRLPRAAEKKKQRAQAMTVEVGSASP